MPELPEVKERSKKTYLITFLGIFLLMYIGLIDFIINIFKINYLSIETKVIANIVLESCAIIICYIVLRNNIKRDIKFFIQNKKKYIDFDLTIWGIFLGIGMISNLILKIVVGEESTNQIIVENLPMVFKIVSGIFLAPILEEIVFRGLLKKVIKNKVVFIIISSLIFGTMHIVPNLINPIQLLYLVPYVLAGVELGFIYAKTDNIFTSITLHMFSNALGILLA